MAIDSGTVDSSALNSGGNAGEFIRITWSLESYDLSKMVGNIKITAQVLRSKDGWFKNTTSGPSVPHTSRVYAAGNGSISAGGKTLFSVNGQSGRTGSSSKPYYVYTNIRRPNDKYAATQNYNIDPVTLSPYPPNDSQTVTVSGTKYNVGKKNPGQLSGKIQVSNYQGTPNAWVEIHSTLINGQTITGPINEDTGHVSFNVTINVPTAINGTMSLSRTITTAGAPADIYSKLNKKDNGSWTDAGRIWHKENGTWVRRNIYRKQSDTPNDWVKL